MGGFGRMGVVAAALATVAASGCVHYGPAAVRASRVDYNVAIAQTNSQELLLNLVRLRYRDNLYFMNVEKVASSVSFSRSASVGVDIPEGGGSTYKLGGVGVSVSESPTVFYAPLEGERFVRELMTPVDLDELLLLYHSGWSIERVFLVTLQAMNGLKNAPSASGPTPERSPVFREFKAAAARLRALQVRGAVELGRAVGDDGSWLELRLIGAGDDDPDVVELRRLLRLDSGRTTYRVVAAIGETDGSSILVQPRALLASMYYLSQGVEVPPADEGAGLVTLTTGAEGARFAWEELLGTLFRVGTSDTSPDQAAVAVEYRGSWFFIDDADLDSKSTFSLLTQLVALRGGDVKAAPTLLSFPVGR